MKRKFITECSDDLNRLVPSFSQNLMDVKNAIIDISDNYFLEIKSAYTLEIVTGFIVLMD